MEGFVLPLVAIFAVFYCEFSFGQFHDDVGNSLVDVKWTLFKHKYDKKYEYEEERMRKSNYEANLVEIELNNYLVDMGLRSCRLDENANTDATREEFVRSLICERWESEEKFTIPPEEDQGPYQMDYQPIVYAGTPPSSADFKKCTESIWSVDSLSFFPGEISINLSGTPFISVTSAGAAKFRSGTYPTFNTLLSNFNPYLGTADPNLNTQISSFLTQLLARPPMQEASSCLQKWGYVTASNFRSEIQKYWFSPYSRSGGPLDSSGFQHVFQGEVTTGKTTLTGYHGWVNTYNQQSVSPGGFVYGYASKDCRKYGVGDLVNINNFYWKNARKDISSMWVGASPEFEIAIYTLCALVYPNAECKFEVNGGTAVSAKTFWNGATATKIGSAFTLCK